MTTPILAQRMVHYAELLVKIGVNLQPAQSLNIAAELGHRDFVKEVVGAAYRAGAKYVNVDWIDAPSLRMRYLHSQPEYLDELPDFAVAMRREWLDQNWARLALIGDEFPGIFDDVEPASMQRVQKTRARLMRFFSEAQMANKIAWCVAGVPTPAWASKVYPHLSAEQAVAQLWDEILRLVRADQPDPIAAWRQHDQNLRKVTQFMQAKQVRSLRFFDPAPAEDGLPSTDLSIGLTDRPVWVAASSVTPQGVRFLPNMPTEEVFTTPHRLRVNGYVRLSKPAFPFQREVRDAYMRFAEGEVVEFSAKHGEDVLKTFFDIAGTRYLGEVALVDMRSPVNQSGLVFYDGLFDENAVCHIAFGNAYPEGMAGATAMSTDERVAAGVNHSDAHEDMMIGTASMNVTGVCADGSEVVIMQNGQFADTVFA